jgi:hypothetical protein
MASYEEVRSGGRGNYCALKAALVLLDCGQVMPRNGNMRDTYTPDDSWYHETLRDITGVVLVVRLDGLDVEIGDIPVA